MELNGASNDQGRSGKLDSRKITEVHNSNVYDNFLIHWKYVKREKIPGAKKGDKQWKYFYKDDKSEGKSSDKTSLKTSTYAAKEMLEKASRIVEKQNNSTIAKGKEVVTKFVDSKGDKSTTEITSLGVKAALVAGTLLSKVVSKVNHETGEKVEEKITEKRGEKSRETVKNQTITDADLVKDLNELSKNDPLPMLPIKTEATTPDEDMALVNPKYGRGTYAYTNNCSYCTAAYDLRARGYDVEADAISNHDPVTIAENIASWYDGEEVKSFNVATVGAEEAAKQLEAELLAHGDGARGHLMMYWWIGGGHDVIWEVEKGEVVIRDCQTNDKLEVIDYLQYAQDGVYFRTDNIQPNEKILETVKSRK